MSLTSALFLTLGAVAHKYAFTSLTSIQPKEGYHTLKMWTFQAASTALRAHDLLCTLCAAFEVIRCLSSLLPIFQSPSSSAFVSISGVTTDVALPPLLLLGSIVLFLDAHIRWAVLKILEPTLSELGLNIHSDQPPGFFPFMRERFPDFSISPAVVFGFGVAFGFVLQPASLALLRWLRVSLFVVEPKALSLSHKLNSRYMSLSQQISLAFREEYERICLDIQERYMYYKLRLEAFLTVVFGLLFFTFMLAVSFFFLWSAIAFILSFYVFFFSLIFFPFTILVALGPLI